LNNFSATQKSGEKLKRRAQIKDNINIPYIIYLSYLIIPKYHFCGRKREKNLDPSKGGRGIMLYVASMKFMIENMKKN
jgi:hypothetical protein